jgi:hypothetical protein
MSLDWFMPSHEVITLCPILLYYAVKFDASDELCVATYIISRTVS